VARRPQVRFFPSRDAFYCQINGRQHRLGDGPDDSPTGPNYLKALDAYRNLLALTAGAATTDGQTVGTLLELYLQHISTRRRPATIRLRRLDFQLLCEWEGTGNRPVNQMTPYLLSRYADHMRKPTGQNGGRRRRRGAWGPNRTRNALAGITAAFAWGEKSGLLSKNFVRGLSLPAVRSRSKVALLGTTPEQIRAAHERILATAPPHFRPFVQLLQNTGARPGEIAAATAADYDPALNAFVYHADRTRGSDGFAHKTSSKGKDRVIFVTGAGRDVVRELMEQRPTGPLFPRRRYVKKDGPIRKPQPLSAAVIGHQFRKIGRAAGMPHLTAYCYRHQYATSWLLAGKSIEQLAILLGNSAQTIRQHYAHLLSDREGLRRLAESFTSERGQGTGSHATAGDGDAE
jgi:integrase